MTLSPVFLVSVESVQTAAENPAAGSRRAEPEAEDCQRAVRAVCEGEAFKTWMFVQCVIFCLLLFSCRKKWRSSERTKTSRACL